MRHGLPWLAGHSRRSEKLPDLWAVDIGVFRLWCGKQLCSQVNKTETALCPFWLIGAAVDPTHGAQSAEFLAKQAAAKALITVTVIMALAL
jgi:hypothetical protein